MKSFSQEVKEWQSIKYKIIQRIKIPKRKKICLSKSFYLPTLPYKAETWTQWKTDISKSIDVLLLKISLKLLSLTEINNSQIKLTPWRKKPSWEADTCSARQEGPCPKVQFSIHNNPPLDQSPISQQIQIINDVLHKNYSSVNYWISTGSRC